MFISATQPLNNDALGFAPTLTTLITRNAPKCIYAMSTNRFFVLITIFVFVGNVKNIKLKKTFFSTGLLPKNALQPEHLNKMLLREEKFYPNFEFNLPCIDYRVPPLV